MKQYETLFCPGDILIPKTDLTAWSVVACDQFTSDPDYWEQVRQQAEGHPSALHVIFPEAFLGKVDFDQTVADINATMERYLGDDIFTCCQNSMIYLERTLSSGAVRHGVVGLVDLECYDYAVGSTSPVRATEGTVLDRIPPRVRVRSGAALELPHVMLLVDDPRNTVMEQLAGETEQMRQLYQFPLMLGGGTSKGWLLTDAQVARLTAAIAALPDPSEAHPLVLAVGDGNHSLATARACYQQAPTPQNRYAMVELCNLHDSSLVFEAIHRAVFGIDPHRFVKALHEYCATRKGSCAPQTFTLVSPHGDHSITIAAPECNLTVGSVQQFLDGYCKENGGTVDYIHGEAEARGLVSPNSLAILLPAMDKSELFPAVVKDGALPRKTFSMGEARDKRYYLECRKIR
ncbi:MAG: DUF1015 domain-containing protein [Angelakisella sp.]